MISRPEFAPRKPSMRYADQVVQRVQSTLLSQPPTVPVSVDSETSYTIDSSGHVQTVWPYLHGVDNWFDQDNATTSGLTWGHKSGYIRQYDGTPIAVDAGTVTIAASTTNYVEVSNAGVVSVATVRDAAKKPIRKLITDATGIIVGDANNVDERVDFDF